MRISQIFAMGGGYGHDDGPYYNDFEGRSNNPCYASFPDPRGACVSPIGPFDYGRRGDRKGLAHILGSSRGGGLFGIFAERH
jgi:hypothetical protein